MAVELCGLCRFSVTRGMYIFQRQYLFESYIVEKKTRKILHAPACRLELQVLTYVSRVEIARVNASVSCIDRLSNTLAFLCARCQRLLSRRITLEEQLVECISKIHSMLTVNTQQQVTTTSNVNSYQSTVRPTGSTSMINAQQQQIFTASNVNSYQSTISTSM